MKATLSIDKITSILRNHGIEYVINNGHILGLEYESKYTDLTNYSLNKLKFWLGY